MFGTGVTDKLAVGGYNAPNSESTHASDFLDENFGTTSNLVIQLLPNEGTIDSPEATKVADQVTSCHRGGAGGEGQQVVHRQSRHRSCVAATVAPG